MAENQEDKRIDQGARFYILITSLGIKQKILAELVGTKQPSISAAIKGRTGIPKTWLYKLMQKYRNINDDWIWTGQGEMLLEMKKTGEGSSDKVIGDTYHEANEDLNRYSNGRSLKKDEVEMMLAMIARLNYRVDELEGEIGRMRQELVDHLRDKQG